MTNRILKILHNYILFWLHLNILFPLCIVIVMLQNYVKTIKNLHRLKLKYSKPKFIFPRKSLDLFWQRGILTYSFSYQHYFFWYIYNGKSVPRICPVMQHWERWQRINPIHHPSCPLNFSWWSAELASRHTLKEI